MKDIVSKIAPWAMVTITLVGVLMTNYADKREIEVKIAVIERSLGCIEGMREQLSQLRIKMGEVSTRVDELKAEIQRHNQAEMQRKTN